MMPGMAHMPDDHDRCIGGPGTDEIVNCDMGHGPGHGPGHGGGHDHGHHPPGREPSCSLQRGGEKSHLAFAMAALVLAGVARRRRRQHNG
jgi:MYXO-CTERM domain-containing protein